MDVEAPGHPINPNDQVLWLVSLPWAKKLKSEFASLLATQKARIAAGTKRFFTQMEGGKKSENK
jgi:hypothetical protein